MNWNQLLVQGFALAGLFLHEAAWSILFGVAVTAAIDMLVDRDSLARRGGGQIVTPAAFRALPRSCGFPGPLTYTVEHHGAADRFCSIECIARDGGEAEVELVPATE